MSSWWLISGSYFMPTPTGNWLKRIKHAFGDGFVGFDLFALAALFDDGVNRWGE